MNIQEKVAKIFTKYNKNTDIKPETSLKDLGLDSLDLVEVLMDIEEEFGIEFEDMESLQTVNDVLSYIEEKTK